MRKNSLNSYLTNVIRYFSNFSYAPTHAEVWKFFPEKIKLSEVKRLYNPKKNPYYAHTQKKKRITVEKVKKAELFIRIAQKMPCIMLLGYSGSVAMNNAQEGDDIDFFIITKENMLWTTRFLLIITVLLLGKKRWPWQGIATNTLCLNLFFDVQDMEVPSQKRSLFTAHEVMQMRPIFYRNNTYARFINSNQWVSTYFPNSVIPKDYENKSHTKQRNRNCVEVILKNIQLLIMRKRTNEFITSTQLWFFPIDASESFQLHDR